MTDRLGSRFGKYIIAAVISRGGLGTVFRARDAETERCVALKVGPPFETERERTRFQRNATPWLQLRHPNLVTIYEVGEEHALRFIAMEYFEGETLAALIRRRLSLSVTRKIELMEEIAAGLQYAHSHGIVHGDIRAANMMLDAHGVLKILDGGIANVSGADERMPDAIVGAPNYMAPELLIGRPDVDARTDQFSAGAVFYELLVHRQAFAGGLENRLLHTITNADPEPLLSIDSALDRGLVEIVSRCLEKSRDNRYTDMAAVRRDLSALRRRLAV